MSATPRAATPFGAVRRSARRRLTALLPMRLRRAVRYRTVHGRWPALAGPRTFTEKVTWRMLRDRRQLLHITCDKSRMKEHALRTAPGDVRVPRTLWRGTDVRELAGRQLPQHWVLKPNHRTGRVLFGSGTPDVTELLGRTRGWLEAEEWEQGGEWAYSVAEPVLLLEERIGDPSADLTDYKFYVYDGQVRAVQVDTARFTSHSCRLYTPDWAPLGTTRDFPAGGDVPRPSRLDEMREAAARIGAGFDFIRVDLYEHEGQVWFGELTPYPGSGLVRLAPEDLDTRLGAYWRLPRTAAGRPGLASLLHVARPAS